MSRRVEVVVTSVVAAGPGEVWARVVTDEGIADELAPWLGMSMPVRTLVHRAMRPPAPAARAGWMSP